jgi:multiple sugar transport system permease protein
LGTPPRQHSWFCLPLQDGSHPSLQPGKGESMSRKVRDNLRAYLFLSPWLISLLLFTAYPMLASFYFAMTRYTIINPPEWIGIENFVVMFTKDELFWVAVNNTLYFTLLSNSSLR